VQTEDPRHRADSGHHEHRSPSTRVATDARGWRSTFRTRQFRRTIAWHIANRPFGTIAGMIQYKHASVAAFEGYAGSSRSGFRAEVEAQRALGQLDDILAYFDEHRAGKPLHGPAASRVANTMDAAVELGPLPAMIADRARLRVLLASLARTLHVGILADCFFDPSTALCLKHTSASDRATPLVALCEPTRCPNACIAARHRPVWARGADDARILLREKRRSELQRVALRRDLHRIEAVLDGITTPASPVPPPRSSRICPKARESLRVPPTVISRQLLNHPIYQSPFLLYRVRKLTAPLASVAVNLLLSGPKKSKKIYFPICARLANA
jgi:hypothetical protein